MGRKTLLIIIGLFLLIVCTSCSPNGSVKQANKKLFQNMEEYSKNNPMDISMPALCKAQLMFWHTERNFIFSAVAEENGEFIIYSSAEGEDLEWLKETMLKGIQAKVAFMTDPSREAHTLLSRKYATQIDYLRMKEKAQENPDLFLVSWEGFITLNVAPPNDCICFHTSDILRQHITLHIDTFTPEHVDFLKEQIFHGMDVEVKEVNTSSKRNEGDYRNSPRSENLSLTVNERLKGRGILIYRIDPNEDFSTDFGLSIMNVAIERKTKNGWERVPYNKIALNTAYSWGDGIVNGNSLYGTIYLGSYEYLTRGTYRLIIDLSCGYSLHQEILFHEFRIR
ncbi:hypothetical protein [Anaerolentibacter hominis]|uniref:hypothetical protein n=1 Tax=Anaerolentibacter hominis TaxID=3079009 RepID=UPI0031B81EFC